MYFNILQAIEQSDLILRTAFVSEGFGPHIQSAVFTKYEENKCGSNTFEAEWKNKCFTQYTHYNKYTRNKYLIKHTENATNHAQTRGMLLLSHL